MTKAELTNDFAPRLYQQTIFANSLNKNSLVVLPTGLGKTVIALMLAVYYFNQNKKKILFLAPTKPLVQQQEVAFKNFIKNHDEFQFQVLIGSIQPKKRIELYKESDFIFSTPQLIENDILNEVIDPKDFGLVIFDEAHRASGNYAYNFIASEFNKSNVKFLALTASPGTSKIEIESMIQHLAIEHLEFKTYEDSDVADYVNKTKLDPVIVELPDKFKEIIKSLNLAYQKRLKQLRDLEYLQGKDLVSKKDILQLQAELRTHITQGDTNENIWSAISISAAVMKLQYGIELLESQEVSSCYNYFYNFFREGADKSKAAKELQIDVNFREAFDEISKLKKNEIIHPKLSKLKEIVHEQINNNKDLKIIVFSQYRDTAMKIVQELSKTKEVKPTIFVGQAAKGEVKMSQKQQKEILDNFRNDEFNVLVSTSVGEEGLDIPKVDLVIFYEPVASAIRTIQRIGRTGRFNKGQAFVLQADGTRDIITKHIANAKEKRMYKVLNEIQKEFKGKDPDAGLGKFINKEEVKQEKVEIEAKDERIPIYVDNRENSTLIKELYKLDEIKAVAKQLNVGDIVIDENIAIERKAKIDFVNSIMDKRLFPQLIDLARNYRRPILMLEGPENIFSVRNVKPNVIRASLSAIAVDLRIPIIFTDSMEETAQMILTIAKRTQKDKKEVSLASDKRSFSEDEELEKVVSNIPRINVVTAKSILKHYKTLKDLVNTTEEKLMEIEGIGKLRAKSLIEFFEREYKNI